MYIEYANAQLEKILSNPRLINKHYGKRATKLQIRLSELHAAECLESITYKPPPRRHKLDHDKNGCWGIDISKKWRIVIEPIGDFDPEDLNTIKAVRIVSIEDYH